VKKISRNLSAKTILSGIYLHDMQAHQSFSYRSHSPGDNSNQEVERHWTLWKKLISNISRQIAAMHEDKMERMKLEVELRDTKKKWFNLT